MFGGTGYFVRKVQRNRLDGMKVVHATLLHIPGFHLVLFYDPIT